MQRLQTRLMNLPSDTPKMQKWMFWVGDVVLVTAAWFIHDGADHPNGGVALILTVLCIVAAVFVAVIPAIVEYARRQDEALDNRQRSLQALAVTVAAAAEQTSIAATGLNGISEAAQDNFSRTERLSKEISDKIAALEAQLAKAKKDEGDTAAKLEAVAKKIGKTAADIEASIAKAAEAARAAAAAAAVQIPEVPPVIASRITEIRPAVSASHHPFEMTPEAPPPAPAEAPKPEAAPLAEAAPAPPKNCPPRSPPTPPRLRRKAPHGQRQHRSPGSAARANRNQPQSLHP